MTRFAHPSRYAVLLALALPAAAQGPAWVKQFGTSEFDVNIFAKSTAALDTVGGVYVCGETQGSLGAPNVGDYDAWLARYDRDGDRLWLRQFGSIERDYALATAPDGGGGVYVAGQTFGDLSGVSAGGPDGFVAHYDSAGNQLWLTQFGSSAYDLVHAVVPGGLGGVYVTGITEGNLGGTNAGVADAFVGFFDNQGQQVWMQQFGTFKSDVARTAVPDWTGGLFVGGSTDGVLSGSGFGGRDAWLARIDSTGSSMWIQQFGTDGVDEVLAAALDAVGGVYVTGRTTGESGSVGVGAGDVLLARFDSAGSQLWTQQFGTPDADYGYTAASDGAGGVYVGGTTEGSLGAPNLGKFDAWVRRYDSDGTRLWGAQLGTDKDEIAEAAAPDGSGGVFLFGWTLGSLGGPSAGGSDAWIARFDEPCGSTASYCSASATSIAGCEAALSASGSPSVANPLGFTISSGAIPGGNLGLCLFGDQGPDSAPFGTLAGLLCVQAPILRTAPKSGRGTAGACDGNLVFSLQDLIDASTIISPGAFIHAQVWSRDPDNADGFLLSDGIEFRVCP